MSITSKRKAQDLVRQGKIHDAISVLREGLADSDADPYDHVYMGDLLMRVGETEDSLSAYQKAIRSYEDVGLYRNAVAIGKKMLRIDRQRPEIHRTLASLYDREGLHGEAIPHYLTYLDSFVGEAVPPTEFLETLDHAASITGSKVEVALRLTDHFLRIRRGDRAAALLNEVANNAEAAGSFDMAEDLRRRATDALGQSDASANGTSSGSGSPPPLPAAEPVAGFEVSGADDDEGPILPPPPPPPLQDVEPISFDTSAMDGLGTESDADSGAGDGEHGGSVALELDLDLDPADEGGLSGVRDVGGAASLLDDEEEDSGFVVEHLSGSNTLGSIGGEEDDEDEDASPFDLGTPRSSASSGAELGFGEVDFSSESEDEDEPDDHVLDLDADADFGAVDLTDSAPTKSESDSDSASSDRDFGAVDFGNTESVADGPGDDHVYEIDVDDSDETEFDLRPVSTMSGADDSDDSDDEPDDTLDDDFGARATANPMATTATPAGAGTPPSLDVSPDDSASDDTDDAAADDGDRGSLDVDLDAETDDDTSDDLDTFGANPEPTSTGATHASSDDAHPVTIESANDAFLAGRWSEARRLYEHILEETPNNRRVLARLVETVRYLQDHHGEVHYLVLLGEVWIEEDELEEALECFLKVVRLDPENATAKRRLSRFREMGVRGAEVIEESDSNSVHGVLETGRTEVAIRANEESFRSEDWVELEGLLEEFKDGLKSQMDDGDYQGHYDLAVSYHGMGLLEEALEAADLALACEKIPIATERQARELKGSCLTELHRYREAVHEYREAVEKAGSDRQARRTALYHLGRSLEALEEWQEAVDTYVQLKLAAPGFLDVEERIRNCEDQLGDSASRPPSEAA